VQSQQGEQQRTYRWHMYLSQSEIREKHRDPTGQQGQEPTVIPRHVGEDQHEQRQRHDCKCGGAGRSGGEAAAMIQIQDQQDRAGDDWQYDENSGQSRTPTTPGE
jgi:hypothetical protein